MASTPSEMISKTFCVLPWIHLSTRPNGQMRLCCSSNASAIKKNDDEYLRQQVGVLKNPDGSPANLNSTDLLDAWNNDFMKSVRLSMLAGEVPTSCTKCFVEEKNGITSKRIWEYQHWSQQLNIDELVSKTRKDGSVDPTLYYLDIRLGNLCNLKCVMCSPHDSSAWTPEWKKIKVLSKDEAVKGYVDGWTNSFAGEDGNYRWHENESFLNRLYEQVPNIQQLYFAGGEPFLIKEHFAILEKCIESDQAKHIDLRYNTNLTVLPPRLLELWKHFKQVRVTCSIDAYGKRDEYIRHPTEWSVIEKHLDLLDNSPDNISVTLACCVSIMNVWHFPDFIRWKLQKRYKKVNIWKDSIGMINWHLVYFPPFLNVRCLPFEIKTEVSNRILSLIDEIENTPNLAVFSEEPYGVKRLHGLIKYMNEEDWSNRLNQAREFIKNIDAVRGTNVIEWIPEIESWIEK